MSETNFKKAYEDIERIRAGKHIVRPIVPPRIEELKELIAELIAPTGVEPKDRSLGEMMALLEEADSKKESLMLFDKNGCQIMPGDVVMVPPRGGKRGAWLEDSVVRVNTTRCIMASGRQIYPDKIEITVMSIRTNKVGEREHMGSEVDMNGNGVLCHEERELSNRFTRKIDETPKITARQHILSQYPEASIYE